MGHITVGKRGILALIAILAVITTLLTASGGSDPAPVVITPLTEAPDEASAAQAARSQGSRVEVGSLRTSTRQVFANPNGGLSADLSPVPVRVRHGANWVPVDTSLTHRRDGSVAPRSASISLALSGGGATEPLARMSSNGKGFELRWPAALPQPRLSGATATYPDVWPGVDLVVIAQVDGFQHNLVIKDAQAAKNPALAEIRLGTGGLRLTVDESGVTHAMDEAGADVFRGSPGLMWDSSGVEAPRFAPARVSVVDDSLIIAPDQGFLNDPATRFPVTLDPDWREVGFTRWGTVLDGKPGSAFANRSADPEHPGWAQVGQCYPRDGRCNGIGAARAYFQYDTGFLAGRTVVAGTLDTVIMYSPDCGGTHTHSLWRAPDGEFGAGLTWNSQPASWYVNSSEARKVNAEHGCGELQTLGFTLFRPGEGNAQVNLWGPTIYNLRAGDEGDEFAWRKFDAGQTWLHLTFNSLPNNAYNLRTDPPLAAPCKFCDGRSFVGDDRITLLGQASDPDGDRLRMEWGVYDNGVKIPADSPLEPNAQGSGAWHAHTIDLRGRDEVTVAWAALPWDTVDNDIYQGARDWAWGREFVVDRTGVNRTPTISAVLYQQDNHWHGGVDVPDTFTFGANGIGDIDHYVYGWRDPPSTQVDADYRGGPASVTLTPPGDGPRDLYVRSVDRAGHQSDVSTYHFYVRAGNGALAQWKLDGNARDTAFLGDRHGTAGAGAVFDPHGAIDGAIQLNGQGANVIAPNAIRTDVSYSISALVKTAGGTEPQAAVTQDGTTFSGFGLWYRPDGKGGGNWAFGRAVSDDPGRPGLDLAVSSAPAQPGVWTHLAGVYDAKWRTVRVFVNGQESGGAAVTGDIWNAGGSVRIGQSKWNERLGDFWNGAIDQVQLYDRVLSYDELAAAVSSDNIQVAQFKLDDGDGDTARNAAPGGQDGVLRNGAHFVDDGALHGAVAFDGIDDSVSTPDPVLDTEQSFTVAAQVKLNRLDGTKNFAVISQDGAHVCGFSLQYQGRDGTWVFVIPRDDADNPAGYDSVRAPTSAAAGDWVHLAAVYDRIGGMMRLYVGGELAGEVQRTRDAVPHGRGPLRIGAAQAGSAEVNFLDGAIDEVRVYSRALQPAEIPGLVSRDDVATARWALDGDAKDAGAKHRDGTLKNSVEWTAGQTGAPDPSDLAVRLNGNDAHVSAPNAVDTAKSFTVTAWARLDRAGGNLAVMSEDGRQVSGFIVKVLADQHWAFYLPARDDAANPGGDQVRTDAVAQVGAWTHLAAVYSKEKQRIELFVNGVSAGSTAHPTGFGATGEFQIGRAKWNNDPNVDFFPGAIDDVTVFNRPLFADEIRLLADRDVSLAHSWALDERRIGDKTPDSTGSREATLSGATVVPGRVGNAMSFNGRDSVVSTTGVDVRTDTNFTVSTWVRLPANPCDLSKDVKCRIDAVSLDHVNADTTIKSKFRLGHLTQRGENALGRWIFEMPEPNGTITQAAVDTAAADYTGWVHLVGVYDAPARTILLYVNGNRVGDGTLDNPWSANGGLRIGRGASGGKAAAFWPGSVDDVRIYGEALTSDRVESVYASYPSPAGSEQLPTPEAGAWGFEENTGTTAADSSGRGHTATFRGGAAWMPSRNGTGAWFDGRSGYAETAGPVLNTINPKGFSVAAWAFLAEGGGNNKTVVAQDSNRVSAFLLQYNAQSGRWAVVVPQEDQDNPDNVVLTSPEPAVIGQWAHLAVVYNPGLRQLRLYVNGSVVAARAEVSVLDAAGPMTFGRARWNGNATDFFPRGVDDVRAFSRALSDGEVRRVHDDAPWVPHGYWRFDDGSGRDSSWRQLPTSVTGGATYTDGVLGKALRLNGVDGSASTALPGAGMRDSFTVSAWARLATLDNTATVLGQDGDRMSGFVLQYNKNVGRWVFGAASRDADDAPLISVPSNESPVPGRWTHLTGVYDYAARQLRIYVDGTQAGVRNDVLLNPSTRGFTIGRAKYNGAPADFFAGELDEVRTDLGIVADAEIQRRAGFPAPAAGQLARFVNAAGDRYTANSTEDSDKPFAVPSGYRMDTPLGMLLSAERPGTRRLYACLSGVDEYTSTDPGCEGQRKLADLGWAFTEPPAEIATVPLYRCLTAARLDRFDSTQSTCEGGTQQALLGYAVGYAPLVRYNNPDIWEHHVTTRGTPPGYRFGFTVGLLAMTGEPGTRKLTGCLAGIDQFISFDEACEGQTVQFTLGWIWPSAPEGRPSRPVYRCVMTSGPTTGDRFISDRSDCEGHRADGPLGYVLLGPPPGSTSVQSGQ